MNRYQSPANRHFLKYQSHLEEPTEPGFRADLLCMVELQQGICLFRNHAISLIRSLLRLSLIAPYDHQGLEFVFVLRYIAIGIRRELFAAQNLRNPAYG